MPGRGPEHHGQVQHLDAAGRRQHPRAVRAPRRGGDVPRPAAPDHGGGERQARLLGGVVVVGDGRGHGAEPGVGFDPETLGGAEGASRRAAVLLAAAARPAGEVRRRAQGLDVRTLPEAVSPRSGQCSWMSALLVNDQSG
jgi:hypothetical protein